MAIFMSTAARSSYTLSFAGLACRSRSHLLPIPPSIRSPVRTFASSRPRTWMEKWSRGESFKSYNDDETTEPENRVKLKRWTVPAPTTRQNPSMFYQQSKYEVEKYLQGESVEPMHELDRAWLRVLWGRYKAFPHKLRDAHESEKSRPFPDLLESAMSEVFE